jgi:hypothetical protein
MRNAKGTLSRFAFRIVTWIIVAAPG